MKAVVDAGALVAIDKDDRRVAALLRVLQQHRIPLRTSAGVVAQVWRRGDRQARLAKVLAGIDVLAIDDTNDRAIGELLGRTRTGDVIDAHVALLVEPGDRLLTSDPGDLSHLLDVRNIEAMLVQV